MTSRFTINRTNTNAFASILQSGPIQRPLQRIAVSTNPLTTNNNGSTAVEPNYVGFYQRQAHIIKSVIVPDVLEKDRTRTVYDNYHGVCWWCVHKWDGKFVGCPFRIDSNVIKMEGFFCSWNCAMAYSNTHVDGAMGHGTTRKTLIRMLSGRIVHPAPNPRCLDIFGGPLTIDAYRSLSCRNLRVTAYPERYIIAPFGIACYVEDLNTPLAPFEHLSDQKEQVRMTVPSMAPKPTKPGDMDSIVNETKRGKEKRTKQTLKRIAKSGGSKGGRKKKVRKVMKSTSIRNLL